MEFLDDVSEAKHFAEEHERNQDTGIELTHKESKKLMIVSMRV